MAHERSCEDSDLENDKFGKVDLYINHNNKAEAENRISGMDNQEEEEEEEEQFEMKFEIWPVQHPMEPPDEDRPVKCPMPDSSLINVTNVSQQNEEGRREDKLVGESSRKRTEENENENENENKSNQDDINNNNTFAIRTVRTVRKKRHYTQTDSDHVIVPSFSTLDHQNCNNNLTVFQILHQLDHKNLSENI